MVCQGQSCRHGSQGTVWECDQVRTRVAWSNRPASAFPWFERALRPQCRRPLNSATFKHLKIWARFPMYPVHHSTDEAFAQWGVVNSSSVVARHPAQSSQFVLDLIQFYWLFKALLEAETLGEQLERLGNEPRIGHGMPRGISMRRHYRGQLKMNETSLTHWTSDLIKAVQSADLRYWFLAGEVHWLLR